MEKHWDTIIYKVPLYLADLVSEWLNGGLMLAQIWSHFMFNGTDCTDWNVESSGNMFNTTTTSCRPSYSSNPFFHRHSKADSNDFEYSARYISKQTYPST